MAAVNGLSVRPETFQSIFNAAPGLYLILLPDAPHFTIAEVNAAYTSATHTKRTEIIGQGLFDVFPDNPADLNASGVANLRASLMQVLQTRQTHKMAIQKYDVRFDGSDLFETKYWSPLNAPVLDEHGEVGYIIHSVMDVTDSVRLEDANREKDEADQQRQRYFSIFSQAPVALGIYQGPRHIIELANSTMLRYWGRTESEVLGKPLFDALPETRGQGFEEILEQVYRTGVPFASSEIPGGVTKLSVNPFPERVL